MLLIGYNQCSTEENTSQCNRLKDRSVHYKFCKGALGSQDPNCGSRLYFFICLMGYVWCDGRTVKLWKWSVFIYYTVHDLPNLWYGLGQYKEIVAWTCPGQPWSWYRLSLLDSNQSAVSRARTHYAAPIELLAWLWIDWTGRLLNGGQCNTHLVLGELWRFCLTGTEMLCLGKSGRIGTGRLHNSGFCLHSTIKLKTMCFWGRGQSFSVGFWTIKSQQGTEHVDGLPALSAGLSVNTLDWGVIQG